MKVNDEYGFTVASLIEVLNLFDKDDVICLKEDLFTDFFEEEKFRYSQISNIVEEREYYIDSFGNRVFGKFLKIY